MTQETTQKSETESVTQPPQEDFITKTANALKQTFSAGGIGPDDTLRTAVAQSLPVSIDQIYQAREAFSSTAQSAFNQILLFYTAGSALLLAYMTQEKISGVNGFFISILGTACFVAPRMFASRLKDKLNAGYDLYAAAIIHACVLHRALEVKPSHEWLVLMERCKEDKGKFVETEGTPMPWRRVFHHKKDGKQHALPEAIDYIAVFRSRPGSLWCYYDFVFDKSTLFMAWVGGMISLVVWMFNAAS